MNISYRTPLYGLAFILLILAFRRPEDKGRRPNILLMMSDNQSWNHLGCYGDKVVRTPNIDKIARDGVRFTNAYCNAPSCTPARAALLTGRDIWTLEEGANLWSTLPAKFAVYPDLLEKAGYTIGYDGKGWGPGNFQASGRNRNPAGIKYKDFNEFMANKSDAEPWIFWFNSREPHRPYEEGSGEKAGINPDRIKVPAYLPDTKEVRADIADYYAAIETFDRQVGEVMKQLEKSGELENTIVIVCSDNGWQMPRGLANLYDFGTRVPLIISWPQQFRKSVVIDNLVTLKDLAPTFLKLANTATPSYMTGKNLLPFLEKNTKEKPRDFIVFGRERHAFVRQYGLGYPGRAIRTKDFLYIRNYEPARWPAGDPPLYGDVDPNMLQYPGATKFYMLKNKKKPASMFSLAFAKRPSEELFDIKNDPDQLKNLAQVPKYKGLKDSLAAKMLRYLKETKDPRVTGGRIIWDTAPYFAEADKTPRPSKEAQRMLGLDSIYNYLE